MKSRLARRMCLVGSCALLWIASAGCDEPPGEESGDPSASTVAVEPEPEEEPGSEAEEEPGEEPGEEPEEEPEEEPAPREVSCRLNRDCAEYGRELGQRVYCDRPVGCGPPGVCAPIPTNERCGDEVVEYCTCDGRRRTSPDTCIYEPMMNSEQCREIDGEPDSGGGDSIF